MLLSTVQHSDTEPKGLFSFFQHMLWKSSNELFGQPYTYVLFHILFCYSSSRNMDTVPFVTQKDLAVYPFYT